MTSRFQTCIQAAKKCSCLLLFLFFAETISAQKTKADSLTRLLATEKKDSSKAQLTWQLAEAVSIFNPDSALKLAQQALFLSKEKNYTEGESRSLGMIAEIFRKIGNYPRALEFNIKKLELEEKRDKPYNLASVLMNIGIVYVFQEEYQKGLQYYFRADSVITLHNIQPFQYNIALNLGDVYHRLHMPDSAHLYFDKSLKIAQQLNDGDYIGTSMTGLAHTYLKQENYPLALSHYQTAITYLKAAGDDDIFCEAALGLASLYQKTGQNDSAIHYAGSSLATAKRDGFLGHQLEAVELLTDYYKESKNIDSAFLYMSYLNTLNDSVNSRDRIREVQIISSNEQIRQAEIEESRRIAKEERSQQLQLLFIGIFIPFFFLLTILLSRVKIPVRLIKILGIVSLLFLFEYLTLLLHPTVVELTHHTPVLEILIFVTIAAILIPAHHRLEHWLIEKLTHRKTTNTGLKMRLKTIRIKMKTPAR